MADIFQIIENNGTPKSIEDRKARTNIAPYFNVNNANAAGDLILSDIGALFKFNAAYSAGTSWNSRTSKEQVNIDDELKNRISQINSSISTINSDINIINSKFNLQNDQTGPSWQNAPKDNIYVYYYEGANTTTCKIPYAHCFVFVRKNNNDGRGIAYALRWDHNSPQIWICSKHDTWGDWHYIPSQNDFNIQTGTITSGSTGSLVEQVAKKSGKQCFIYINWTGAVDISSGLHIATLPDGYRPVSGMCISQVVTQLTNNDHFLLAYVGTDGKVWIRNRSGGSYSDYFRMSFSFLTN